MHPHARFGIQLSAVRIKVGALIVAVAALGAVATLGALASEASAASALPRAPADLGATARNHGLQVRPAAILYTEDGTGFLGDARPRGKAGIDWTRWTARVALGTAFNQIDNCRPSCATGPYHGYRVRIEAWRSRKLHGALVFTRLTIFYAGSRPPGEPRHYTFTDTYVRPGGFGWGPPGASYCTRRKRGSSAAVGCNNIHSLPPAP